MNDLLKRITIPAMLFAGMLSAGAQELGEGIIINPYPPTYHQTFLQTVTLAWDYKLITLVTDEPSIEVTVDDKKFDVYADIYFDYDIAWELGQTNDDPAWGNTLIVDFSDEVFSLGSPDGLYSIFIPEGLVEDEEGNTNAEQWIYFYKVSAIEPVAIMPADGMYKPEELKEVLIKFSEEIEYGEGNRKITLREKNDWLATPTVIEPTGIVDNGKSLMLDLSCLEKGKWYDINIPESYLLIGNDHVNSDIWLEYMVWDGMGETQIISAPEYQSSPDVKPFILTWDYQTITMPENAPDTEFVCGFPDYGEQDGWRIFIPSDYYSLIHVDKNGGIIRDTSSDYPANALYLDVNEFTEDFINYQFEIFFPAGLVVNDKGLENPPISYVFNVMNIWSAPEITAEAGVIDLVWKGADWVTYNLSDEDPVLESESGEQYTLGFTFGHTVPGQVSLVNESVHGVEIDLNGMNLPDDAYTLIVPQGYVLIDGKMGENVLNGTVTYKFEWKDGNFNSSSVNMTTQDEIFTVYNLQGMKVKTGTDLNGISSGIYIVNGKKVLIR